MRYLNNVLCILGATFLLTQAKAQEIGKLRIGIESGTSTYVSEFRESASIRATNSISLWESTAHDEIETSLNRFYTGIKGEYLSSDGYLTLLSGVRYTHFESTIERDDFWNLSSNTSKFYILYNQNGTLTEYAQARNVKQSADYLGIPLEMRMYTMRPRFFRLFVKMGFDLSFKVGHRTKVDLVSPTMRPYEHLVAKSLGAPASFLSTFNPSIGFKLGKEHSLNANFEVLLPAYIFSNNTSSIVTSKAGIGVQLFISYPIN